MKQYDIAVIGGGWAGIAAAAAAARRKMKTVLIEQSNAPGGLASNGFIGGILGFRTQGEDSHNIIQGEFARIIDKLHAAGGCCEYDSARAPLMFNPETLKIAAENYLVDLGVDIWYHTVMTGAAVSNGTIEYVDVYTSGIMEKLQADVFIDCTGNGDLLAQAGADFDYGRPGDGRVQALGLVVYFTEVDPSWVNDREAICNALAKERECENIRIYHSGVVAPESAWGNQKYSDMIRVGGIRAAADPRNAREVSMAEIEMRRSAAKILEVCRKNSKAFDNASIIYPSQTGVRECRRMCGLKTVDAQDIIAGTKFPDAIARGVYWIDIHCPMGYFRDVFVCDGQCSTPDKCRQKEEFPHLLPRRNMAPPLQDYFTVPFGALCSRNIKNLLSAGRCISATSEAIAALRVMAICAATGEAAGAAGALAVKAKCLPAQLDIGELQDDLRANGALI